MPDAPDYTSLTVRSQRALDRARLRSVEMLQLWTDEIHDLTRLRAAPRLKKLTLDQTSVRDLTPLANAGDLEELYLFDNPNIEDLSVLAELRKLRVLEVGALKRARFITHGLRSIVTLPALVSLSIWGASRAKLGWLASLGSLEELVVYGSRVNADWLSGLERLRTLHLTATATHDMAPLARLRGLEDLWLCESPIRDVSPLGGLDRLGRLLLKQNALEDIDPLADLAKLQRLDVNYNRLVKLPSFARMMDIQTLDLGHNRLTDVSSVQGLERLELLSLRHNQLTDVSGLRDLPRLRCLFLNHNRLRDLRPLLGLRSLVAVDVEGNPADSSVLMDLPAIHRIDSKFRNMPA